MRFVVRLTKPVTELAAKARAAALEGQHAGKDDDAVAIRLPSTSSIRDPALLAELSLFDGPDGS